MAMETQLGKWGDSVALRIPADLVAYLGGDKNARVEITGLPSGGLLIKPVTAAGKPPTRAQIVAELRQLHATLPMGSSVVREMRDAD